MNLEFDKEIDAILRKARSTGGVLVGDDPPEKHLDADTIAAFAENALPQKVKLLYMEHFADCGRCRKQLSFAISMNNEAAPAASRVTAPVAAAALPWYQTLFKTPNLAISMGALILAFSGILGYLALQNTRETQNATITQVAEPERPIGGPHGVEDTGLSQNSNMSAAMTNTTSAAAPANAMSSNKTAATSANSSDNTTKDSRAQESSPTGRAAPGERLDKNFTLDGVTADAAKPVAAPPPPASDVVDSSEDRDEQKSDATKLKEEKDMELSKRKYSQDRRSRELPPPAAKVGPSRSGPLQNQSNQINNNAAEMSVSRVVGGKTFNNRNRAWYDSAYRGQATVNIRRGTDDYKRLDNGLRGIADALGGTAVVIWKGKAYRIQ